MTNLPDLAQYLDRGGAAVLQHPAAYGVAEGALLPPARYAGAAGGAEFCFERRYVDGDFVTTALFDSKGSQSNRSEEALVDSRRGGGVAEKIPAIRVTYPSTTLLDMELPHRLFDAHIRAATQDGVPVVKQEWYQAARDATAVDLTPVFTTSPTTLALGGWDSSRDRGQLRLRSLFVSELFGVVDTSEDRLARRSGARLDPLGQDFHVSADEFEALLDRQREHMSPKTVEKLERELAKERKKGKDGATLSASHLGLGGVPPSRETPFGVSVPEVRRVRTYSLAGLRRLRFGGSSEDDVAARTALLALMLLGAAYADADPSIRAYCDLTAPRGRVLLDEDEAGLDLSIPACEEFFAQSVDALPDRLAWSGQVIELVGDPALDHGATADSDDA